MNLIHWYFNLGYYAGLIYLIQNKQISKFVKRFIFWPIYLLLWFVYQTEFRFDFGIGWIEKTIPKKKKSKFLRFFR